MKVEVIRSNSICEYCRNKYDYKFTGESCPYWYKGEVCREAENFEGKELIETELVPDIERYDIEYANVSSELEGDIIRADYIDQSYVDCVSVNTLKKILELLKLYRSKLG